MAAETPALSPDPGTRRQGAAWIDPAALMRIKNLQWRARAVVEGFCGGLHRSPYHGFSVEFSEYRAYVAGDDPRFLDWRLYARTDRCYIKRFEDETNLRCHLVVDLSRSMGYGSLAYTKAEYARTTAATLAYYLARQRDCVGLVTFDEQVTDYLPARFRPGHLHRLIMALERALGGKKTDLTTPIEQVARTVTKRGLIVLISDLLAPIDTLRRNLGYLRSRGHEVVVMRVLDPAEVAFSFDRAAYFEDMESGRLLYVDPRDAREQYLSRFAEHEREIQAACSALAIDYFRFSTSRPLEMALLDFLSARTRRGRRTVRRGGGQGGR